MRQATPLFVVLLLATHAMAQPAPGRGGAGPAGGGAGAGKAEWSPGSDQRRTELRQTLQAQRQADMLVGPQVAEPLASDRHLSPQERQALRQQLQQLRQTRLPQPEPENRSKP